MAEPGDFRQLIGTIGDRHIFACRDKDSLWVEVAGPKGGDARQYAPGRARALAVLLNDAAHAAETGETP